EDVRAAGEAAQPLPDRLDTAQKQVDAVDLERQRDDVLERSILRLMILHGRETTTQTFVDENNEEAEEAMSVGLYVLRELEDDDMCFSDPVNQRILEIYQRQAADNQMPVLEDLMQVEDAAIKGRIVDISYNPHEISSVWSKKLIRVSDESDVRVLNRVVMETIANFKLRQIEKLERALSEKMKSADMDDAALLQCLMAKKNYEAVRKILSGKIRRVL
ncbi:MAG: hypothetical protein K2H70_03630, partial [Bacteroidales bacterium]|nr:hypothetical protein [Bacteroidales bacterium]